MKPQLSKFDTNGKIEFTEVQSKARDMTRLQSGMFIDRPDLWQSEPRKHRERVAPEQLKLFCREAENH